MKLRRPIPILLVAMLALTACRSESTAPTVVTEPVGVIEAPTLVVQEATIPDATEPPPTGLPEPAGGMHVNLIIASGGSPKLYWDMVTGAVRYDISRSFYPDHSFAPLSSTERAHYSNPSAPKGLTLYYQVHAIGANEELIDSSPVLSIDVPLVLSESRVLRYVAVHKVKLHTHPDSNSPEIPLRYMDEIELGLPIISRDTGTWYRVYYQGALYYMLMQPDSNDLTQIESRFAYSAQTTLQQNVLDLALDICNNWNTTYLSGGSGSINAAGVYEFDCSGLVTYILNNAIQQSIPTYRLSSSMSRLFETDVIYNAGFPGEFKAVDVPLEEIRPGDVLFFRSQLDILPTEELGHCSLYLGNNEFIHCTSVWEDAVCIMPLTGDFRDNLLAIRRYIPDEPVSAETVRIIDGPYQNYKVYSEKNSASAVVATQSQGDTLTILYTNNDDWAYVRTPDDICGWFRMSHFGDAPAEE